MVVEIYLYDVDFKFANEALNLGDFLLWVKGVTFIEIKLLSSVTSLTIV